MADPNLPKPIAITLTSGLVGQPITILNRNNSDIEHGTLSVAKKYVFDLNNFDNGYTAGHVIEFIITGEVNGSNIVTTSGTDPQAVTVSTSTVNDNARGI